MPNAGSFRWAVSARHVAVFCLAASLAAGCRSNTSTPTAAAVSPDTWATVDGRNITRDQVDKAYRRLGGATQNLSEEETLAAKLNILNDLILQEILLAKAGALKVELPDKELETAYSNAKANITDEAFQQELSKRSLTPDDMREGLRRELLTNKVLENEIQSKVNVTDQEVTAFFDANRAQFNFPEEAYHIAQIVVTPVREAQISNRSGDDATSAQASTAKTKMLLERLKAGTRFSELAMEYSEDPESAPRGGDLGFVPVSKLKQAPPLLRNAVLGVEPGRVNVVSDNGAHTLVLVVAHEKAGQRDLSTPAVRESITNGLKSRKEQLLRAAYLTAARTDADVVNYLARRLVETQGKAPNLGPAAPASK
jgi:peptidyl-prolyl cis-trans isomerase SurA